MQRWREKESPGEMRRCAAKIRNPRTDLYHSFDHGSVLAEEIRRGYAGGHLRSARAGPHNRTPQADLAPRGGRRRQHGP